MTVPKTDPTTPLEPKPTDPTPTPAEPNEPTGSTTPEPKDTDWKAESRKWEQRAKDNKKALDEAAPKLKAYGEWEAASKTELEKANERVTQFEDQVVDLMRRAVQAEIRARSTGFIDTDVPFAYLQDLSQFVDDKGEIDTAKIDGELAELLKQRPALARTTRGVPAPNPAIGSSGGGEPDVAAQRQDAMKKGDWRTVMRLENQKLFAPPGA